MKIKRTFFFQKIVPLPEEKHDVNYGGELNWDSCIVVVSTDY